MRRSAQSRRNKPKTNATACTTAPDSLGILHRKDVLRRRPPTGWRSTSWSGLRSCRGPEPGRYLFSRPTGQSRAAPGRRRTSRRRCEKIQKMRREELAAWTYRSVQRLKFYDRVSSRPHFSRQRRGHPWEQYSPRKHIADYATILAVLSATLTELRYVRVARNSGVSRHITPR